MSNLSPDEVINMAACPECGAAIGTRCDRGEDTAGGMLAGLTGPYRNHQERVAVAYGKSPEDVARMSEQRSRRPPEARRYPVKRRVVLPEPENIPTRRNR